MSRSTVRVLLVVHDPEFQKDFRHCCAGAHRLQIVVDSVFPGPVSRRQPYDVCVVDAITLEARARLMQQLRGRGVSIVAITEERSGDRVSCEADVPIDAVLEKGSLTPRVVEATIKYALDRPATDAALRQSRARVEALLAECARLQKACDQWAWPYWQRLAF